MKMETDGLTKEQITQRISEINEELNIMSEYAFYDELTKHEEKSLEELKQELEMLKNALNKLNH